MPTRSLASLAFFPLAALACGCCSSAPNGSAPAATRPFKGVVHAIPGTIEAENFDEGPMGTAYHDLDPQNQGAPYRETSADIEQRSDASGGYGIGWTKAGEWLAYTVDIAAAGTYRLEIPVASNGDGGTFHLEVGGKDVTGPIKVPTTGSWQTLKVISKDGVKLPQGRHVLRVVMDTEGETTSVADVDLFRFTAQ
jgi:hypothetical protein